MVFKNRPGLTLLEVLMAIFIMGIGMLSVLAMFPAAADMMGRAKKNYETAEALVNAAALNDGVDFFSSYKNLLQPQPSAFDSAWAGPISAAAGIATATANVVAGKLVSVTITNPGSGYTRPPYVFISGGGGDGALGIAFLGTGLNSDKIAGVVLVNQGSGYTSVPSVAFTEDYPRYMFIDQRLGVEGVNYFGNIPITFVNSASALDKFFTMNSDLPLDEFGRSEKPSQSLGKYTISYLLEKPKPASTPNFIRRYAMVFKERDTSKINPLADHKNRFKAISDYPTYPSSVKIVGANAQTFAKRQWLMLTVEDTNLAPGNSYPPTHVRFVEIRSINEVVNSSSPGGYDADLEISPPLIQNVNAAYHLLDVVWVAYLGL